MVKIDKIVPGGQGIGTLEDGKKIFLWNVLPGEEVEEFLVTKKKSKYLEGIATKIAKKSEKRVKQKDDCFLSTSPWQIFDYQFELKTKGEIVKECFTQNGIKIDIPEVITYGKEWNYRNKMEYALYFDKEDEKIKLAFHQRGTHRKVPIKKSSIERPEILEQAEKIVLGLNERREEARKYQSLILRCSKSGVVSGGLYENHKAHPVFPSLSDEILGISYRYSPNGFFQINLPVYEMALREIKENLGDSSKILDLYSGVGTIGLSVASDRDLTLVECDKSAYSELEKNCRQVFDARLRSAFSSRTVSRSPVVTGSEHSSSVVTSGGPSNEMPPRSHIVEKKMGTHRNMIHPILAKSEEALEYIEPEMTVILDPPRAGCHQKLLERILEVLPERIVYLSCNPITQARDVAILSEKYQIMSVKAFNFFPKTPHIENLVVFVKNYPSAVGLREG